MTGAWLTVKWLVVAIFVLSIVLQCVAHASLRGRAGKCAIAVSAFVLIIMGLPIASRYFEDAAAMRASWVIAGTGVFASVFALLYMLLHQKHEVVES